MTNIDQFESLFKKADKQQFELEAVDLHNILVIGDGDATHTQMFLQQVVDFLDTTLLEKEINWHTLSGDEHSSVADVVDRANQVQPDLICTFRNLKAPAVDYPYSLGVYLEVLSQATDIPVLVLPSPYRESAIPDNTQSVMAIADHLTGDNHLVSYAARLTSPNGKLLLTHVEDQTVFNRYIQVIGKIPSIDTESAADTIMEQLLREPHEYILSCAQHLKEAGLPLEIGEIVTVGHSLRDYQRLIEQHDVDLLVLNTKQEDQLAMHGLAYPLCVQLRDTPILML
ncbi:MAG TPA: hypothetical protein DDW52_03330 [Planctomycetaceae bacterium]|nr:hypothetical protein [Planctomycetaceae bacterium]